MSGASGGGGWIFEGYYEDAGSPTQTTTFYGIDIDSSDNIYIPISNSVIDNESAIILKLDVDGGVVDTKKIDETSGSFRVRDTRSITVDSSGNLYFYGFTEPGASNHWIAKYNSSFSQQWSTRQIDAIATGAAGNGKNIAVDSSGNVYAIGTGFPNASGWNSFCIQKLNSSGTVQWRSTFGNLTTTTDEGKACVLNSNASALYVVGTMDEPRRTSNRGAILQSWNTSTGNRNWQLGVDASSTHTAYGEYVARDSSDNVYMAGYHRHDNGDNFHGFVLKSNSSGTAQWYKEVKLEEDSGESIYNGRSYVGGLDVDSSGNVYVAYRNNAGDVAIAKYDSSGNKDFSYRFYNGDGQNVCRNLRINSSGNIVVNGYAYKNFGGGVNKYIAWVMTLPGDGPPTYGSYGSMWNFDAGNLVEPSGYQTRGNITGGSTGSFTNMTSGTLPSSASNWTITETSDSLISI